MPSNTPRAVTGEGSPDACGPLASPATWGVTSRTISMSATLMPTSSAVT